jgi:general L-amino acid transport system substrate-binding protein
MLAGCSSESDTAGTEDTEPTVLAETTTPAGETATGDATDGTDTGSASSGESVLDSVIANDVVRCGTRDDLPGFATLDAAGARVGFDSDFCRVIAAAVLGDATKVEFVDLETEQRFTALQAGEIDVLVRNTTWTASRDGIEGATFMQPTFYDGQGMMVAADSGFASIDDMDGTVVCVAGGTTSEGNVATEFARRGLAVEVQSFEDVALLQEAFVAGRCDGWSSDTSQLTGLRSAYPDGPDSLVIFDDVFSKEPLAPAVADGDSRWAQAVDWAIYATIQAEELGITQANVGEQALSTDPNVQRFLGGVNADGTTLDVGLGLQPDANLQVVTQVGNYGEIFDRHLAPLGLSRGLNALWNDGGLMYAPPFR